MLKSSPIRGAEKLQAYLKKLPRGTIKTALDAISDYILGNDSHGLRHYEPYKYVTRKAAYGQTFQSDKQRRWFYANGGPDMIGDNRTGETAGAWTVVETNNGYGRTFSNPKPSAVWLYSDDGQANQLRMVGHRTLTSKIMSNLNGALRSAGAAITRYLSQK